MLNQHLSPSRTQMAHGSSSAQTDDSVCKIRASDGVEGWGHFFGEVSSCNLQNEGRKEQKKERVGRGRGLVFYG